MAQPRADNLDEPWFTQQPANRNSERQRALACELTFWAALDPSADVLALGRRFDPTADDADILAALALAIADERRLAGDGGRGALEHTLTAARLEALR